jgi:hypothetical protein
LAYHASRSWKGAHLLEHGCVAMTKERFPELDQQQLNAWEAEHGWLYR